MQDNNVSTTPTVHQQIMPSGQQKEQERASGVSSSSPTFLTTFVGQEVCDNAANGCSQKKPSVLTSAPSSSSTTTAPDASISSGAAGNKASDPYSMCSRPKAAAVVNKSPSPTIHATSPIPSPESSSSTTASPRIVRCEYPGCSRPAKYRQEKDAPPIACQAHKRKGQYTINRKKELLIATRDGDAFRTSGVEVTAAAASGSPGARGNAKASGSPRPLTGRGGGGGGDGGGSSSTPSRRKQAAKPRTPAMQTLKGSSQHKHSRGHEPGQESQGRPCLFPGCDTQPGYGLPGAARAVYCLSHKKSLMVRIIEKPLDAKTHGQKRKAASTASAPTEGKAASKGKKTAKKDVGLTQTKNTATTSDKKVATKALSKPKAGEGLGEHGSGGGAERGIETSRAEGATMTGEVKPQERIHRNTESLSSSEISTVARTAAGVQVSTTATVDYIAQGPTTVTTPPPPPATNRMAEKSGMAPSVEMLLLRQAREAAKEEARASGRRPRAPSRRALEASGKMQGEGAQWMTREKKAEQARAAAELREQRRLYKEAGLKFGVVVETLVEPAAAVSGEGDNAGCGGSGGAEAVRSDPDWQKFPAALLVAAPQLQSIIRDERARPEKRARPNSPDTNA